MGVVVVNREIEIEVKDSGNDKVMIQQVGQKKEEHPVGVVDVDNRKHSSVSVSVSGHRLPRQHQSERSGGSSQRSKEVAIRLPESVDVINNNVSIVSNDVSLQVNEVVEMILL